MIRKFVVDQIRSSKVVELKHLPETVQIQAAIRIPEIGIVETEVVQKDFKELIHNKVLQGLTFANRKDELVVAIREKFGWPIVTEEALDKIKKVVFSLENDIEIEKKYNTVLVRYLMAISDETHKECEDSIFSVVSTSTKPFEEEKPEDGTVLVEDPAKISLDEANEESSGETEKVEEKQD